MVWNIEPINILIGAGIVFIIWLVSIFILKPKKNKTTLPTMKKKVIDSYNHLVDASNNLLELKEVFDEIEESK